MLFGNMLIRPIAQSDYEGWRPLWDGYNAFYGRSGPTALAEDITKKTWQKFFDEREPVHALVAAEAGRVAGLVHYLFHRSTTRSGDVCYLQDLFTLEALRGRGIGRRLIEGVYDEVRKAGVTRVYWHTHVGNETARTLYDKVAKHQGFILYSQDL